MLFRKKMPRACKYCARSARLDEETLLCAKKGVVSIDGSCRKFQYDPLKRIPVHPKAVDFSKYDKEDYSQ